jgi:hypothetical protein
VVTGSGSRLFLTAGVRDKRLLPHADRSARAGASCPAAVTYQDGSAVQNLAYSGGFLDRASARRADPGWVAMFLDAPGHG